MKHISIPMSAVVLGLALAVGTGAALAHDAGHSHGDHAHGPASFDAGQPGDAAAASRRGYRRALSDRRSSARCTAPGRPVVITRNA